MQRPDNVHIASDSVWLEQGRARNIPLCSASVLIVELVNVSEPTGISKCHKGHGM
jgi:hypothetical protein